MMLILLAETLFAQTPVILTVQHQTPIADSETLTSTPLIQVKFDDPEAKLQKEKLLIEVDRNDVTSIAQFSDSTLTYQPAAPLNTGTHEVKINGTLNDGTTFQEVKWSFKITEPEVPRNLSLDIQPTISFEQALHQEGPNTEDEILLSNIVINSRTSGPITTSLNSTFQGQDQIVPGRTRFDLANLQASMNTRITNLFLGDVILNHDQLAINNLARRGILFQQGLPFLRSSFDVFSVRSETIFGFRHGLGVANSEQRIDGGSFFFSPTRNETLGLRMYYLRGENALAQGFNFGGVTRGEKGDGYGVNLTSVYGMEQLRFEQH
jgi:hypothetical protein